MASRLGPSARYRLMYHPQGKGRNGVSEARTGATTPAEEELQLRAVLRSEVEAQSGPPPRACGQLGQLRRGRRHTDTVASRSPSSAARVEIGNRC